MPQAFQYDIIKKAYKQVCDRVSIINKVSFSGQESSWGHFHQLTRLLCQRTLEPSAGTLCQTRNRILCTL